MYLFLWIHSSEGWNAWRLISGGVVSLLLEMLLKVSPVGSGHCHHLWMLSSLSLRAESIVFLRRKSHHGHRGARAGFCHCFSLFLLLSLETANMGARTLQWLGSLGSPSVRLAGWNCSEHCFNQQGLLCLDRSQFGLNSGHGGAFPSLATHSLVQASYALVWLLSPRPPAGVWLGGMLLEILDVRQVGSYAGQQAAARDI